MAAKEKAAEPQEVVAEIVEDCDLAPIDEGMISVNFEGLMGKVQAMNDAIADAVRAMIECDADNDALEAMPYEDVKRLGTDLNGHVTACETARKAFNGDYDTPKKAVKLAYDAAMEPVIELRDRYKEQRVRTEAAIKQGHREALEEAYAEFMEGNGLAELRNAVPLDRFIEKGWWDSVAKSFSEKNATNAMIKRATEIIDQWNSVKATPYRYPEQAQATFFRTLSLQEVAEQDARMWEEAQRVAAANAEIEENRAYCEPVPENCAPEYEPVPDIVAEAEQVVARAEKPSTWVLCVDLTPSQYETMIAWFKANGVHGLPMRTAFAGYERAAQMVKAVCNV